MKGVKYILFGEWSKHETTILISLSVCAHVVFESVIFKTTRAL